MRCDLSLSYKCTFSISKLYKVNIPLYIFYFLIYIYIKIYIWVAKSYLGGRQLGKLMPAGNEFAFLSNFLQTLRVKLWTAQGLQTTNWKTLFQDHVLIFPSHLLACYSYWESRFNQKKQWRKKFLFCLKLLHPNICSQIK